MHVVNIPIESLEERYSKQWNEWFPREFEREGVSFETVYPAPLTDTITTGSFLDVCGTNYFKACQLADVCRMIYEGRFPSADTVFFFHDLWFPGLEMLAYIRQGMGLDFKIVGVIHAGTYDPYDFLSKKGMGKWGEHIENGWFQFVDGVFVATDFHFDLLSGTRLVDPKKMYVTGLPIYANELGIPIVDKKENIVVFPHRLDSEKNPGLFEEVSIILKELGHPDWLYVKSKDVTKTKSEYYELLAKAKIAVSFADQETWGIAMQESVFAGCFPVVPDRLSYRELYQEQFRFNGSVDDCVRVVIRCMDNPDYEAVERNRKFLEARGEIAIRNMIYRMKEIVYKGA